MDDASAKLVRYDAAASVLPVRCLWYERTECELC